MHYILLIPDNILAVNNERNKDKRTTYRDEAYILRICDRIERSVIDIVTSSFLIMRLRIY